jgi:hypothetical protein
MFDWYIILNVAAAALGPLMFLRVVANDIEWAQEYRRRFEERERRLYRRRMEEMSAAA